MKILLQRVSNASVTVKEEVVGKIEQGFVALVGVTHEDTLATAEKLADKVVGLRVFGDEEGKMNLSIKEVEGRVLSVSQFTLYGNTDKGRRPHFSAAAKPEQAKEVYDNFNAALTRLGVHIETGRFGEHMDIQLTNDGPVTFLLEK
ncbi:D-aminoacyl-tRNA deacylase [Aureibacillus halotolerans]|uniref:D-aminoacyl-tRNA deacylase n=1 Tax=Aureibacillus halotolerans TaxID=1508390 RepID=A0A4R6U4P1_9BACI|nr:D-aminoacyl-tRNA deacylase [Aureibacillus halotolerans]TDQ37994.1 D-tyrosyl-tRNA(Tyr) deacylase [Aureibacillus halotolerans]